MGKAGDNTSICQLIRKAARGREYASVITNGVTPRIDIPMPLISPTVEPAKTPSPTASGTSNPRFVSNAQMTLTKPIVAPTEISKPPTISAKLWPIDTTSMIPATRAILSNVPDVAKLSGNA